MASNAEIESVLGELLAIRDGIVSESAMHSSRLEEIDTNHLNSALNLLHYLGLRRLDLRDLQRRLAGLGLSSLGRAESHVMAALEAVINALRQLAGLREHHEISHHALVDLVEGEKLLEQHTETLLGPRGNDRAVRIMVTMPTEAAYAYTLVHSLLKQGMNCMRINCAHDSPVEWRLMIENLRRAERTLGRSCRVVMDLGGPKLRTGPLEEGPAVLKIRPQRDDSGHVLLPARIWLHAPHSDSDPPSEADARVPVAEDWLQNLENGDSIRLTDARGSKRRLQVVDVTHGGCWAEAHKTTYLTPGTALRRKTPDKAHRRATVGDLPPLENYITLRAGDLLVLTRDQRPGRPATSDSIGRELTPATIGCTIPEVFNDIATGEQISFDDGKICGTIERVLDDRIHVRITRAKPMGTKLRADKGINLPDSALNLGALTDKDRSDLEFVAEHADVVELSFANTATDVDDLQDHLRQLGERRPCIVLKIETKRAFDNLPDMLLTAMRWPSCGVMIARGDLAVECGFQRLAEVQEEILWICEAAHVPVIWATQVLESLAKRGMPSRAEITDAAMGHRAECVMLNKGPHIVGALELLDDILQRMQDHQTKKSPMLRELQLAHTLPAVETAPPLSERQAQPAPPSPARRASLRSD